MASSYDRRSASSATSRSRDRSGAPVDGRKRPRGQRGDSRGRASGEEISRQKREEREERLARLRRGTRARLALAVTLAVLAVSALVGIYRSQLFEVKHYRVVGARQLKSSQVLLLAKAPKGATLLRFPASEVKQRLLSHPWIEAVEVARTLPDTVELRITERTAVAMVDTPQALWLVDGAGFVLEKRPLESTAALPVIRDVEGFKPRIGSQARSATLANGLAVLAGLSKSLRAQVRAVIVPSVDETALLTGDGVEVLIGPAKDLEKKDAIALKILSAQRGKVVSIDVRSTDRPISRGLGQ